MGTIPRVNRESWAEYVRRVTRSMTQADIAQKTGMAQTAVSRWLRGDVSAPKAESVVAFAKAIGQPPVEALVAAGLLDPEDAAATVTRVQSSIRDFTTDELFDELRRRTLDGRG